MKAQIIMFQNLFTTSNNLNAKDLWSYRFMKFSHHGNKKTYTRHYTSRKLIGTLLV